VVRMEVWLLVDVIMEVYGTARDGATGTAVGGLTASALAGDRRQSAMFGSVSSKPVLFEDAVGRRKFRSLKRQCRCDRNDRRKLLKAEDRRGRQGSSDHYFRSMQFKIKSALNTPSGPWSATQNMGR
jgi:hypothetical protein